MGEPSKAHKSAAAAGIDAERVILLALSAVAVDRTPRRRLKMAEQWIEAADQLQYMAEARAGVYPINGGGKAYGERPADVAALEAARVLRDIALNVRKMALERLG